MSAQVINSQPLEIQPDRQAGVRDYGRDAVMDMVYFTARTNYERQVMRHLAETRQDIPFELDVRPPLLGRMTGCSCSARSSSETVVGSAGSGAGWSYDWRTSSTGRVAVSGRRPSWSAKPADHLPPCSPRRRPWISKSSVARASFRRARSADPHAGQHDAADHN
jgi:hypothetical protein